MGLANQAKGTHAAVPKWQAAQSRASVVPSATSETSQGGKPRKAEGSTHHITHTHTDMAAEGTMPGGLWGPRAPSPREVPIPRYSTWANYPSPGNLGPPIYMAALGP